MYSGLFDLPWWGYIVATLAMTHVTIAAVTIYLHRHSAHRALDLHPLVSHFFRFWLWLTTGMATREWTAVHRKHHARCETPDDPHSPQILGIGKIMWQGADLYKLETKNRDTLEKFGQGTPDDWIERSLYTPHSVAGIATMMIVDIALFGFIGITIWAVQMMWIPFFAAGIINGVGHYWGYRSFQPEDASRNIVPWGIIIGGEELHNNHHAYPSSARLSNKWWEFDAGWMYIRIMAMLGLARVKKIAPKVNFSPKAQCDLDTLQAVITHRYEVLAKYARSLKQTCAEEIKQLKAAHAVRVDRRLLKRWLHSDERKLSALERERMREVLSNSRVLATINSMRQELTSVWQRSSASKDELVRQLEDWCHRAEASGIVALQDFSRRLRCYQLAPA
ncbi:MAG: fatty acid desaturase [Betaproteobacteria bacterium]|nr:fatty acid desaturase [Betaproteobacteria bacterium]